MLLMVVVAVIIMEKTVQTTFAAAANSLHANEMHSPSATILSQTLSIISVPDQRSARGSGSGTATTSRVGGGGGRVDGGRGEVRGHAHEKHGASKRLTQDE
jgi:hypothetical protein